jgi:DNA repair protein SbcC/Rad50
MRPLRLELEGFTSFAERTALDFSALDLFAITGPTGAGKSSLIDALIFALYGWIPRVGKEYRQLISHGAERLAVQLEFQVGAERFRVSRNVRKSDGKVQARLERLVDGEPESVAGRVLEIESEIERIVGLDHDAFTRSVVLPQGEFDRFLKGKPEERRKILVSLLNLRIYEDMHRIANGRAIEATRHADFIGQQLATDYAEATPLRLAEQRKALKAVQVAHKQAEADGQGVEDGLAVARVLRTVRRDLETLSEDLATATRRVAEAARAAEDAGRQHAEVEKKLAALAKESTTLGFDEPRLLKLLEVIPLLRRHGEAEVRLRELDKKTRALEKSRADAAASMAALQKEEPAIEKRQAKAVQALADAKQGLEDLKRRHAAAALGKGLKQGDPCPVCERPLDHLPSAHVPGIDAAEGAVRAAERELESLRQRRIELSADQKRFDADAKRCEKEGREARETLKSETKLAESLRRDLATAGVAEGDVEKGDKFLTALERERQQLQKAKEADAALRARREKLDQEKGQAAKDIAAAQARAGEATKQIGEIERRKSKAAREYAREHDRLLALAERYGWPDVQAPPAERDEVAVLDARSRALRSQVQQLDRQSAELEAELKNLQQKIQRAGELQAEQQGLKASAAVANELAASLRANQFIAYIQEEALRVLAEDGSKHLKDLSQGRYALTCDEQEFSVIDHWNADEVRSVKTLSGGESFLASLALALALAERVASFSSEGKAQQRLDSLFLDEGFGSLDRETLDVVVQGIEALHGGQRMVGIVTHIPDLAERMPVRVEVAKHHGRATLSIL